jgi:hypothetical protein
MSVVFRGLPVLVEAGEDNHPQAFWWQNRRCAIWEHVCHWDDSCGATAHWLVQIQDGQHVSLVYDRASSQWMMECIGVWPKRLPR